MKQKNEQALKASANGSDMAGQNTSENRTLSEIAKLETEVLKFWQENKTFEQSLQKESPRGEFVFYDGPPFATGTPHYGHILAGILKDVVPRYRTMNGYHVARRWGWDCHGLPIENLIQKEQNLKSKKDIEDFGIKKFNQCARDSVFRYDKEWREIVPRTGRWVDMEDQYTTMDATFSESVINAFKTLYDKGLVYEDFKAMHISPPLETPLSNFEVNLDYRDITDISVYVKFELLDEPNTFLIAWTTTPWTLPGNVAVAVGADIDYIKVAYMPKDGAEGLYIVAKERLAHVFKDKEYVVRGEMKGVELVGKSYKPLFDYYSKNTKLDNHTNGWKVYAADFVTTVDGSGIVHEATAFGEEDLELGKANNLPFVQHVNLDGTIRPEVTDFAGRQAKPMATKENPNAHQETDIEVIKYLAHHGTLFEKEKIVHSYPHCWRTGAPLLNYAMSSWFVRVTDYRDKMISLNKKINWVPKAVGEKRFGNWLENIKDWGISRSRFWGTPIPIWKSEDGMEIEVLGSVEEIRERTRGTNKYFVMRHGESDNNIKRFLSSNDEAMSRLTENGRNNVSKVAELVKAKNIDVILCSPLNRTRETANQICEVAGIDKSKIIFDDRLKEVQCGKLNGKSVDEYRKLFKTELEKFSWAPEGAETVLDVKKRVGEFIYEVDKKYQGKNILIVTHEYPIWMLETIKKGLNNKVSASLKNADSDFVPTAYFTEYDFAPIPHNDDYELDFHRPFIDDITYEKNGKKMLRIKDVFDTWFDSGSMSFATNHYPFNKENFDPQGGLFKKPKGFPADYIAEGLDQTRGWFYTLLALNTGLFGKAPFKNVIVNGLVLAEDGRKMSKSLRNYPDPEIVLDKYGADAMRYYMLSSPIVRSEPLNFTEKGVDEIVKKINNRLLNVVSFYKMYGAQENAESDVRPNSENPLDQWILERLVETGETMTKGLENYELDRAARPIMDFVDDLSTWYLRRSRDRFKEQNSLDKNVATKTIAYVLLNLSKLIAPFMPFLAENIYQKVTGANFQNAKKSVHLLSWPKFTSSHKNVLDEMKTVRNLVTVALESRDKVGIKVRQPLQTLFLSAEFEKMDSALLEILKDEVNIKEIRFDSSLKGVEVKLDSIITEELKREGISRDLIRFVQTLRKEAKLQPEDTIALTIHTDDAGKRVISEFEKDIKSTVNANKISIAENDGQKLSLDGVEFTVKF